jgi:hypothetical protein
VIVLTIGCIKHIGGDKRYRFRFMLYSADHILTVFGSYSFKKRQIDDLRKRQRRTTMAAEQSQEEVDLTLAFGPTKDASQTLFELWESSKSLGIDVQDMYGNPRPEGGKWLGDFEAKVAQHLGKEAGLFLPSGTMAQQVMLKIAQKTALLAKKKVKTVNCEKSSFFAHPTSHLLNHEHDSYAALLNMTVHKVGSPVEPLSAQDIESYSITQEDKSKACALILEVPHREIGGQITSWADVESMKTYCEENGLWFHMVLSCFECFAFIAHCSPLLHILFLVFHRMVRGYGRPSHTLQIQRTEV